MLASPETLAADRLQAALTRRFLLPVLPALEETFLALRADTDAVLQPQARPLRGQPYPYGYCQEITQHAVTTLWSRVAYGRSPGERALKAFLGQGGSAKMVWGALRERYFQNAIQLGSLYVDVSNDTVDLTKPKVEILPMSQSGLKLIDSAQHFVEIARRYWGVSAYANTILPSLAPLFPIVFVDLAGNTQLQSKTDHMMRLFASDGFSRAERWLREGPTLSDIFVRSFREACPPDVLAADPLVGVDAALAACQQLRGVGMTINEAWVTGMSARFDRIPVLRITASPPKPIMRIVSDTKRSNAHIDMSVSGTRAH